MMKGVVAFRTLLNALTIALVVIGVFFWLKEPSVPSVDIPAAAARSPGQISSPPKSADAGAIVSSNMFSATRAAPSVRYTPPGAGGTPADVSATQGEVVALPAHPRGFGTMTGPNGATALIQPDSAGSSSRLYREGERVGSFRIEKILTSSVIVRGPAGRIELKVEQGEDRRE